VVCTVVEGSLNLCVVAALIALAWLTYPLAGAARVSVDVLDGKRPEGAGFSFLPELVIFPTVFFVAAWAIDSSAPPLGSLIISVLCTMMLVLHVYELARAVYRHRSSPRPPS
jgi:hypothetical protein